MENNEEKELKGWSNEISTDKNVEQLTQLAKEKKLELDKLSSKELNILARKQLNDKNIVKKAHIFGSRTEDIPVKENGLESIFDSILTEIFELKEEQINNPEQAMRFNEGKPQWALVHFDSLVPMIRVLEFGALKYAPRNWMKPMDTQKILESMQRHLAALFDGEEIDEESGISHMGHIMCNAMFFNYHNKRK